MIRAARPDDLERVQQIERAAGSAFAAAGMPEIAADDPVGAADFAAFLARDGGWVWVAGDEAPDRAGRADHPGHADRADGYLLIERLDDAAHVEQVSVHPDRAGQRIGARLLDFADRWAAERGLAAVTLTTFATVAWNAPYYRRLGFGVLPDHRIGPGLRARIAVEAGHGLARWPRVAMIRPVEHTRPVSA